MLRSAVLFSALLFGLLPGCTANIVNGIHQVHLPHEVRSSPSPAATCAPKIKLTNPSNHQVLSVLPWLPITVVVEMSCVSVERHDVCVAVNGEESCTSAGSLGVTGAEMEWEVSVPIQVADPGDYSISASIKARDSGVVVASVSAEPIVHVIVQPRGFAYWHENRTMFDDVMRNWESAVPSAKHPPPLSLEPSRNKFGPDLERCEKSSLDLVVMFAGEKSKPFIHAIASKLDFSRTSLYLFLYDWSDWSKEEFPWLDQTGQGRCHGSVTVTRSPGNMKWWFVKRFLFPELLGTYRYIHVVDSDVEFSFDLFDYGTALQKSGILIGQPSHCANSQTTWDILYHKPHLKPSLIASGGLSEADVSHFGEYTTFVECGPLTSFSSTVWPCIWKMLDSDLTSGYGYDLLWIEHCAPSHGGVVHSVGFSIAVLASSSFTSTRCCGTHRSRCA